MNYRDRIAFAVTLSLLTSGYACATTLEQAVKETLITHPQISASMNSRYSADQDLRAAKGGYLPTLDISAGTGWEQTDSASTRASGDHLRDLHRSESSINLSQNLFNGFATTSEVARQKANVNARAYTVMNTAESTALTAIQNYLNVLMQEKMVTLAEDNLKNHERIFDQIRLRTEQGVGRQADYEQAEARLAQARNNLLTEQTNLEDARANYFSVVGHEATDLTLPQPTAIPASLEEARKVMLENNPLLKQAQADVEAARQLYESTKSRFYPSVDVDVGRRMDNNVDGTRGHDQEWQDVKKNTLRQLNEELRLAWNALVNARQQVPIAKDYADRSMVVRTAYQEQFSLGDRTLLDMLDSENEVFTAQRRYVELEFTEMFTHYRINARTGELLKQLKIPAPSAAQPVEEMAATKVDLPELK